MTIQAENALGIYKTNMDNIRASLEIQHWEI
jgi:hypothetical protein